MSPSKTMNSHGLPVIPVPAGFRFMESVHVNDSAIAAHHHVAVVNGEVRYRVWSGSAKSYVTASMTREQYRESRLLDALLHTGFNALIQEFEGAWFLQLSDWISGEGVSSNRRTNLVAWDRRGEPLSPKMRLEIARRFAVIAQGAIKDSLIWNEVINTYW